MSDDAQSNEVRYTCPECQAGLMRLVHITYFTWLSGELITVPDFPAWVCDLCGRREYDCSGGFMAEYSVEFRQSSPFQPTGGRQTIQINHRLDPDLASSFFLLIKKNYSL